MAKNTTSPKNVVLTVVQVKLLEAILNSEFHSVPMADRADAPVWFNTVVQSPIDVTIFKELKKAGLVENDTTSKDVNEHTCCVTVAGFDAYTHAKTPVAVEPKADVTKPAPKAKTPVAVEPKTAKTGKKAVERKNPAKPQGLGIAEKWIETFRTNEAAWNTGKKADVMTDEEITKVIAAAFPGRDSEYFAQVQMVRSRINSQKCAGIHDYKAGETFSRFVKHTDGKMYKATPRGTPLNNDGTPLAEVVAPAVVEPKAEVKPSKKAAKAKADEASAKKAVKVAPAPAPKAKKMVVKKAAK